MPYAKPRIPRSPLARSKAVADNHRHPRPGSSDGSGRSGFMRFAPWAALLAVIFVAAPSPAQYWGPPSGRRVVVTGFVIGVPGFGYTFVPSYGMMRPGVVIV